MCNDLEKNDGGLIKCIAKILVFSCLSLDNNFLSALKAADAMLNRYR